MTSPRLQNWPSLLDAHIERIRRSPFAWGVQDCCQVARGCVLVVTGVDPAAGWGLRAYRTERGAASQLRRLGGLAALPVKAGCADVPLLMAGRGDVVLVPNAGRPALGVVLGRMVTFAGEHGLEFVPVEACGQAWRVG
jgi:hypothetical protein